MFYVKVMNLIQDIQLFTVLFVNFLNFVFALCRVQITKSPNNYSPPLWMASPLNQTVRKINKKGNQVPIGFSNISKFFSIVIATTKKSRAITIRVKRMAVINGEV